jgi:hypothetical protein
VSEGVSPESQRFIRFYRNRRDLFASGRVIADVAVLRSFPSQVFGDEQTALLASQVEQTLIENRVPFQIIGGTHLANLSRYRAVVLAGCGALSEEDVEHIRHYVESGGRVCSMGPLATHDRWMRPRQRPALADLPASQVVRMANVMDLGAITRACGGDLSLQVAPSSLASASTAETSASAPADRDASAAERPGLCAELMEQPTRRLIHLVNYRDDGPFERVNVRVRLPDARRPTTVTLAGPNRQADATLAFKQQGPYVSFTIPTIKIYEIAMVNFE